MHGEVIIQVADDGADDGAAVMDDAQVAHRQATDFRGNRRQLLEGGVKGLEEVVKDRGASLTKEQATVRLAEQVEVLPQPATIFKAITNLMGQVKPVMTVGD